MTASPDTELIKALQTPDAYPHPVRNIQLRETHISWVLLTGDYAYKIKKPVNFGFLDFSTLEKRHFYCEEEIRLNRRLAPELYLQVVPVCGDAHAPQLDGKGDAFEYAVRMRQFDTRQAFDELLARDELTSQHMEQTAQVLARFHARIHVADKNSAHGTPAAVCQPVMENFSQLQACLDEDGELARELSQLQAWSENACRTLESTFLQRKAQGFVRECHGDLHLRNIIIWQERVTPFDGIEFSASLRWIDVLSELAFLLMDLDDHQRQDLAQVLLNTYLEITGDYAGLALLRFYLLYRAMVRAKVACLRLAQTAGGDRQSREEMQNYIDLASAYTQPKKPRLIITHGLSGSGKTFVSRQLLEKSQLIRLRSDVERKRLFGLEAGQASGAGIDSGIYQADASQRTYQHLLGLADQLLACGYCVLVDAAFLQSAQREMFTRLAHEREIPFLILHCEAAADIQHRRIQARGIAGHDASEADLQVLQHQLQTCQPLSDSERQASISVDTGTVVQLDKLISWLSST